MIILWIEPLRIDISLNIILPDEISLRVAQYDVFPLHGEISAVDISSRNVQLLRPPRNVFE